MGFLDLFTGFRNALFGEEDVLANRRRQPRIPCEVAVRCKLSRRTEVDGMMRDIGVHGMRVSLRQKVYKGQRLTVFTRLGDDADERPGLRCKVAWVRSDSEGLFQVGLRYDDTKENLTNSWVHYLILQRNCPIGERRDRRVDAGVPVEIRDENQTLLGQGLLLDLSLGGAKISSENEFPAGTLRLRIGGMDAKMPPLECLGEMVGREGRHCRFKFFPADVKEQRRLRRLLLNLLAGMRKANRPKTSTGHAERKPAPPPPSRPSGPLMDAVKETGKSREGLPIWAAEPASQRPIKREKGFSKFLRSQSAEARAIQPRIAPIEPPSPQPYTSNEDLVPVTSHRPWTYPPERPLAHGWHPRPQEETYRGWARCAGLLPASRPWPDVAERPTLAFWTTVAPLLPGNAPVWGLALESCPGQSPALPVASRVALLALTDAQRRPLSWLAQTIRTRERLERRRLSLLERGLHVLSFLGLGGPLAVKSMLVSGQVVCYIARELGLADPIMLSQLRLAALLKDLGEAALWMGLQEKRVRDRWGLYLRGLDVPSCDLEDLTSDWMGFRSKPDLWCDRCDPEPLASELMPLHPWMGELFMLEQGFSPEMASWVRNHHEALDGSGYPDGLQGNRISWQARSLAIGDAFGGMIAEGMLPSEAIQRVQAQAGRVYDPALVNSLYRALQRMNLC